MLGSSFNQRNVNQRTQWLFFLATPREERCGFGSASVSVNRLAPLATVTIVILFLEAKAQMGEDLFLADLAPIILP